MHVDAAVFDFLKTSMGFESDVQLMSWLGISRDSLSGIRTGRLPMGDTIRFLILNKWWTESRQSTVGRPGQSVQSGHVTFSVDGMVSGFSAQSMLQIIRAQLKDQGKDVPETDGVDALVPTAVDAELLETYKVYKNCATDTEVANLLGIKRHSISMVRSGRNRLGPMPLLKMFSDLMGGDELGLQAAVQSSEALLSLMNSNRAAD